MLGNSSIILKGEVCLNKPINMKINISSAASFDENLNSSNFLKTNNGI
ncbi:hypothetical protein MtrunA17_Chr4g0002871 [Medicago truncatula]|uniref:Uncharacterized protein n=1 Tax=Medicago truncatula TaxID=3880 RepID=A0A396I165_MEDTR|nr:hypothetical protein MtrunA17_Chr4g0002871 [Medicago truncatula]